MTFIVFVAGDPSSSSSSSSLSTYYYSLLREGDLRVWTICAAMAFLRFLLSKFPSSSFYFFPLARFSGSDAIISPAGVVDATALVPFRVWCTSVIINKKIKNYLNTCIVRQLVR